MANASWIKDAVFYQIYPVSFFDGNGDGLGDLKGITQKVGYVKDLGVNAVWLNPVFKSPFKDAGYDISDYYAIDKRFGTMEDLEEMIKVYHENGIKVILDMVFGHTSDKHPWFKKSTNKTKNKFSDYYIWTNSNFEDYDHKIIRGLYYRDGGYLPNYYASQPALNFGFTEPTQQWQMHYTDERLKPLREELLNVMRFYLDKGADGFRFDFAGHMVKGDEWDSEDPKKNEGNAWLWQTLLGTLRKEYSDKVYIAEWDYPINSVAKCGFDFDFLTHDSLEFNTLFRNEPNENLVRELEKGDDYFSRNGKGSMETFKNCVERIYGFIDGKGFVSTPSGSHDEIRMSTFKTADTVKTIFAFLLTYRNVAFIYYGDEIGIKHNFNVSRDGGSIRTGTRTPMQWTNGKNKGFSEKKTIYLPTNSEKDCSVESQQKDEYSILNTVKTLIKIRKAHPCLNAINSQKFLETGYPAVYERTDGKETVRVYINPSDKTESRDCEYKEILYSQNAEINGKTITLNGQSFAIVKIK
ncbi:MAG: cellulase family glycosylhydrolase [Clostridia bacterium]|nr:cellulase family glycosylhydrolase [Clostridia bacterium]